MRSSRQRQFQAVLLLLSLIGLILILVLPSCQAGSGNDDGGGKPDASENANASVPPPSPSPSAAATPTKAPEPVFADAVWMAVGDVMMHKPQLPGSFDKANNRYNFDPFFAEVKPILEQGDWVIANLETPIAGAEFGYSGYPLFNAPAELAEALKTAGFNLITNANNHSLDQGESGVLGTLANLKALGLPSVGTAVSREEADKLLLVEKNGIVMGLLAYTYGTNGIPIPEGKPYLVNLIDEQKIKNDIAKLRQAGADFITVSLHFGTEYQTTPSEEQKRLARSLIASGADIIAGSHPHVVQPYEVVEATDGNGRTREGLIIYSMGNFISNQRGDTKDYGVIFKVGVRKNMSDGTIAFTEIESIPTWVHRYKPDHAFRYRVLPIEDTIAAKSDTMLSQADYASLQKNFDLLRNRLESMK
ncbi:CapA family protein [Paenibacillus arenilitoris]|uniref:CapA family protein n=1 Tax=Paenibacillus arenilitoris TaxID=2772299 RepID=A0A927CN39_9BACL|nr:CapA family protein [Paenibacillus arenilitoris]MBD2869887.1 CapA family protein [Paenibacillus arenilitoris]